MRFRLGTAINRRRRPWTEVVRQLAVTVGSSGARLLPWVVLAMFIAGLPSAVIFGWGHIRELPAFELDDIEVSGNSHMTHQEVLDAVGFEGPGTNIFAIDPATAEEHIARNPWVATVHVRRILPDRVTVTLTEREVGGLVMVGGLYLADRRGVPFKEIEFEQGIDSAIVTGLGDDPSKLDEGDFRQIVEAFDIMKRYEAVGLAGFDRLSEVQVDSLTGYSLVTERRRIRVLLGDDRIDARLARLSEVFKAIDGHGIKADTIRLDSELSLDRIAVSTAEPRKVQ